MATLIISLLNASRRPLEDEVDVTVTMVRTNNEVARKRGLDGRRKLRVPNLIEHEAYVVRALPMRHRPVGQFITTTGGDKPQGLQLFCPVDPRRAIANLPDFDELDATLKAVLERSTLERDSAPPPLAVAGSPGTALYDSLMPIERAGLLNLFCKMRNVPLGDRDAWSFVHDLYRVRGDRIFANVVLEFRDRVKNAATAGTFREADGSLHTPPPGFCAAGSFKTRDRYGNLQLTFFSSVTAPLTFKVDADIDDAAGIEHAFQVIDHFLTDSDTHPFDIHQILTFFQGLPTGYDLIA